MANRVVLDVNGLRVSRPGFNVLTQPAIGKNVAFDSRWSASSMIVTMGAVTVPTSAGTQTVNFGETLPAVPAVFLYARSRSNSSQWFNISGAGGSGDVMVYTGSNETAVNQFYSIHTNPPPGVQKYTNRLVFQYRANWLTGFDRITYIVLRP